MEISRSLTLINSARKLDLVRTFYLLCVFVRATKTPRGLRKGSGPCIICISVTYLCMDVSAVQNVSQRTINYRNKNIWEVGKLSWQRACYSWVQRIGQHTVALKRKTFWISDMKKDVVSSMLSLQFQILYVYAVPSTWFLWLRMQCRVDSRQT